MFKFGIEHEVAFLNFQGKFADFSCTKAGDFKQIINQLPVYETDYQHLRVGDAGIKVKRWYIEGFERYLDSEKVIEHIPKGIEIRTSVHSSIQDTINELTQSFNLLTEIAGKYGFLPVLISFNPYQNIFTPQPPLNDYELKILHLSPEKETAHIPMLTYGPDLNISYTGLSTEQIIDIGQKLTYYSPYIVPFSYSSPFYQGDLWSGLSVRTFMRTGKRPATMVFLGEHHKIIKSHPSLTKKARIPQEVGRIEFKAFDSCDDFTIYAGLLALLKGLILDQNLTGRALVPDANLHQISAQQGLENPEIFATAETILNMVKLSLAKDSDRELLAPLERILQTKKTKAHQLISDFQNLGSITKVLQNTYNRAYSF